MHRKKPDYFYLLRKKMSYNIKLEKNTIYTKTKNNLKNTEYIIIIRSYFDV